MKTWIFLNLILINFINCEWRVWKKDRRKIFIWNFTQPFIQFIIGPTIHHSKIDLKFVSPRRKIVQKMIVDIHDHYRSKVTPPASNMLKMVMHNFLANCRLKANFSCLKIKLRNAFVKDILHVSTLCLFCLFWSNLWDFIGLIDFCQYCRVYRFSPILLDFVNCFDFSDLSRFFRFKSISPI